MASQRLAHPSQRSPLLVAGLRLDAEGSLGANVGRWERATLLNAGNLSDPIIDLSFVPRFNYFGTWSIWT